MRKMARLRSTWQCSADARGNVAMRRHRTHVAPRLASFVLHNTEPAILHEYRELIRLEVESISSSSQFVEA